MAVLYISMYGPRTVLQVLHGAEVAGIPMVR